MMPMGSISIRRPPRLDRATRVSSTGTDAGKLAWAQDRAAVSAIACLPRGFRLRLAVSVQKVVLETRQRVRNVIMSETPSSANVRYHSAKEVRILIWNVVGAESRLPRQLPFHRPSWRYR